MMQVVVNGAGIAGLASAAYLRLLPQVAKVTVLDSSADLTHSFPAERKYTGLWTPALKCLDELCASSTSKTLMQEAMFISGSGYRGWKKGEWIIRPNSGLQPYMANSNEPALGFFTNKAILTALHESLYMQGKLGRNVSTPNIRYKTTLSSIHPGYVETSTGNLPCDLLIAADGADSATYSLLHGRPGEASSADRLVYRGYDVYRGVTQQSLRKVGESFQMWGPGARFAMVPVRASRVSSIKQSGKAAGSKRSNKEGSGSGAGELGTYAWFAAVSRKGPAPSASDSSPTPFSGPFSNKSYTASPALLGDLRETLHGWPKLVEDVLDQTRHIDYSDVTVTPAWASRKVEQVSKVYSLVTDYAPTGTASAAGGGAMPVAFVGDAFHTFDPILAVGAGAALEQARALYYCLQSSTGGDTSAASIATALHQFNSTVCARAQKLDVVSDLAQRVGVVQSPLLSLYRNAVMSILPEKAKGRVMDSMIRIVASSE